VRLCVISIMEKYRRIGDVVEEREREERKEKKRMYVDVCTLLTLQTNKPKA